MSESYLLENSVMGKNCKIYERAKVRNCTLENNIVIGEDSFVSNSIIDDYVQINRRNQIDDVTIGIRSFTGANTVLRHAAIGKYTSVSWNVSLGGDSRHHYDYLALHPFAQLKQFGIVDSNEQTQFKRSIFGNDVWIGMDVTILAGVSIGDGAVIGAGSVVTKDVPPYAIAFGSPAVVHKMRFDEAAVNRLLDICWWDWSDDVLKENIDLFSKPLHSSDIDRLIKINDRLKSR